MIGSGTVLQVRSVATANSAAQAETCTRQFKWSVVGLLETRYLAQVTDNSGAKTAQCINQSGRSWGIGDIITVAIKSAAVRGAPVLLVTLWYS